MVHQGLPKPAHVATETRRLPRVYPVYRRGYADHLGHLEAWAATHPRLLTFGRQGLFVPDNIHHTLAMGRAAASVVGSDGTVDRSAWKVARETFLDHVVED